MADPRDFDRLSATFNNQCFNPQQH